MGAGVWELVLFFCLSFSTMTMIDDGVFRSMSVMRFLQTKIFACMFSNKLLYAGHTAYYIPRFLYYMAAFFSCITGSCSTWRQVNVNSRFQD